MPDKSSHTAISVSRILVMDDEPYIRDAFGELLKRMGFDVEYAAEGDELLHTLRVATSEGHPFNAVIMDLSIPDGKGGKETIGELRKFDHEIKAFVSSGYSDDPIMVNPESFGFTDKISKPFRSSELKDLMQKWMLV